MSSATNIFKKPMTKPVYDTDENGIVDNAEALVGLSSAEITQLGNINAVTISNTQWGYLGGMDQGVAQADIPTFGGLTLGDDDVLTLGNITLSGQINYAPTITFTNGTNLVNATANTFSDGDIIQFTGGGTTPAELSLNTDYFIVTQATNTFQVALTSGGAAITFTDDGTATVAATLQPVLDFSGDMRIPDNGKIYIGSIGNNIDAGLAGSAINLFAKTINGAYFNSLNGGYLGIDDAAAYIEPTTGKKIQMATDFANVYVGIGTGAPAGKLHVDQSVDSAAIPTLVLDQADVTEGFINFIGSDRGTGTLAIINQTASVRAEINGTVYRLALYANA